MIYKSAQSHNYLTKKKKIHSSTKRKVGRPSYYYCMSSCRKSKLFCSKNKDNDYNIALNFTFYLFIFLFIGLFRYSENFKKGFISCIDRDTLLIYHCGNQLIIEYRNTEKYIAMNP